MFCRFGIAGTQPAGGRHDLIERGVDPPRFRADHLRQGIDVRALQLGILPVFEDFGRQRVQPGKLLQHLGVGAGPGLGRLLDHRQLQLGEQQFLKLLGRGDVQPPARHLVNLRLQRLHPLAVAAAQLGQPSHVDLDAVVFQLDQHVDQRQFQRCEAGRRGRPRRVFGPESAAAARGSQASSPA